MRLRRPCALSAVSSMPCDPDLRPGDRHPAEMLGEQAADGVDVVVLELDAQPLGQLVDVQPGAHPQRAVRQLLDQGGLHVVLVGDLADDLLEHVLDGDQSGRAAVLVDDDRDVGLLRLHLAQQLVDRLALGHEDRRPHDRLDLLDRLAVAVHVGAADQVLEVGDAEHVVGALADDRDAAEAAAQGERERLAQGLVALDEDDVGARHHHLAHDGVAELEDRVDHRPLAVLDELVLLGQVDQLAQLGLGRERPVAEALARA